MWRFYSKPFSVVSFLCILFFSIVYWFSCSLFLHGRPFSCFRRSRSMFGVFVTWLSCFLHAVLFLSRCSQTNQPYSLLPAQRIVFLDVLRQDSDWPMKNHERMTHDFHLWFVPVECELPDRVILRVLFNSLCVRLDIYYFSTSQVLLVIVVSRFQKKYCTAGSS